MDSQGEECFPQYKIYPLIILGMVCDNQKSPPLVRKPRVSDGSILQIPTRNDFNHGFKVVQEFVRPQDREVSSSSKGYGTQPYKLIKQGFMNYGFPLRSEPVTMLTQTNGTCGLGSVPFEEDI